MARRGAAWRHGGLRWTGGGGSVPKKSTGQSPVQNKKQPKLAHGHNGLKLCNMVTLIEPEWFSLTKKKKLGFEPHMKKGKGQCLLMYITDQGK